VNWPVPYRRGTLLVPSGPPNDLARKHLFIVLTDPCPSRGDVLLVNVPTIRRNHDPACRLFAGDHPFLKHDSFVEYAMARIELAQGIATAVATGRMIPRDDLDGAVFARVCNGLTTSRFTKPRVVAYYRARTGLQ